MTSCMPPGTGVVITKDQTKANKRYTSPRSDGMTEVQKICGRHSTRVEEEEEEETSILAKPAKMLRSDDCAAM